MKFFTKVKNLVKTTFMKHLNGKYAKTSVKTKTNICHDEGLNFGLKLSEDCIEPLQLGIQTVDVGTPEDSKNKFTEKIHLLLKIVNSSTIIYDVIVIIYIK
ncbi:unnamed protein product [Nezara viridula]|uniref:Uncharacterized protein n=1 Tax=Nezara viridula TaxID=85310 RepID=A0A9P0MVN3_NEZVI|nr:unnamed protein product [Nezara viridula]